MYVLLLMIVLFILGVKCEEELESKIIKMPINHVLLASDATPEKEYSIELVSEEEAVRRKLDIFSDIVESTFDKFVKGVSDVGYSIAMAIGQSGSPVDFLLNPFVSATSVSLSICPSCTVKSIYNCMGFCKSLNLESSLSFLDGALSGTVFNDIIKFAGSSQVSLNFLGVKNQINLTSLFVPGNFGIGPLNGVASLDSFIVKLAAQKIISYMAMGI